MFPDRDRGATPQEVPQAHHPDDTGSQGLPEGHDQPVPEREPDAASALQYHRYALLGHFPSRTVWFVIAFVWVIMSL